MPTANGQAVTPESLRDTRRAHRQAQLEVERLIFEKQKKLLESTLTLTEHNWYDWGVDAADRYRDGDQMTIPVGSLERTEGQVGPLVPDLYALSNVRDQARLLYESNPFAIGIIANYETFVIGEGFKFLATSKDEASEDAIAACQDAIDNFVDLNDFDDFQAELFRKTRIDGETFLRYFNEDGETLVRLIEPEQVVPPPTQDPAWSWGVKHLREQRLRPDGLAYLHEDIQTPVAYGVAYGGTGAEPPQWEEVPANQIDHIKVNVSRNTKRGLSDFFPVIEGLERSRKLVRNLTEGAAIQAAIVGFRKSDTASKTAVEDAIENLRAGTRTDPATNKTVSRIKFLPGTIPHLGKSDYVAPPFWSQNSGGHVAILQAGLRAMACRWGMPEYMATGDASNANYSSTLVAGSPFTRRVRIIQKLYKRRFLNIVWRMLKNSFAHGRFDHLGLTWPQLLRLIDVQCEAPTPEIAARLEEAQAKEIEHRNGIVSKKTWRMQQGLDDEQERLNLEEEPPPAPPGPAPGGMPGMESLAECGGKGGTPGPCPSGGGQDNSGGGGKNKFGEPKEPKTQAIDPLDISNENVEEIWQQNTADIISRDQKLSPQQAGSLAAARILTAVRDRASEYRDSIDAKVKRGESITDEEDAKYIAAEDARRNIYDRVVKLSGYRPYEGVDEHPEVKKPLVKAAKEAVGEGIWESAALTLEQEAAGLGKIMGTKAAATVIRAAAKLIEADA